EGAGRLGPEDRHGRRGVEVLAREVAAGRDLVAVERQEVAADAADVAFLIGRRRADAGPRVLLQRNAVDGVAVDLLAVAGVIGAQAEVRRLQRGRAAILDDRGGLHVELVEAAEL